MRRTLAIVFSLSVLVLNSMPASAQVYTRNAWANVYCHMGNFSEATSTISMACDFDLADALNFQSEPGAHVFQNTLAREEADSHYAFFPVNGDPARTLHLETGYEPWYDGTNFNDRMKMRHVVRCSDQNVAAFAIGHQKVKEITGHIWGLDVSDNWDAGFGGVTKDPLCATYMPITEPYSVDQFYTEIDWTWYPGPACSGNSISSYSASALRNEAFGTGVSVEVEGECTDMNDAIDIAENFPAPEPQPEYHVYWFPNCVGAYTSFFNLAAVFSSGGFTFRVGIQNDPNSFGMCTLVGGIGGS